MARAPAPSDHRHRREERSRRPVRDRACPAVADPGHPWPGRRSFRHPPQSAQHGRLPGGDRAAARADGPDRQGHRGRRRAHRTGRRADARRTPRRPADHRREHAGGAGRSAVRGVSRSADRHGLGHPARPGDRPPERVVIWIGGVGYGGSTSYPGIEFNLSNDIAAANVVFDSGIAIWQVPSSVYSMVSVGYAELEEKIGGSRPLGEYLIRQLQRVERHLPPGAHRVAVPGRLAGRLADALPTGRDVPDRPRPAVRR